MGEANRSRSAKNRGEGRERRGATHTQVHGRTGGLQCNGAPRGGLQSTGFVGSEPVQRTVAEGADLPGVRTTSVSERQRSGRAIERMERPPGSVAVSFRCV